MSAIKGLGINLDSSVTETFNIIKFKSAVKYMIVKLDEKELRTVGLEATGNAESSFQDFMKALPLNDSRYAAYHFEYETKDSGKRKKLIFVHWSPEKTPIKKKMAYAGAKQTVFGSMDGFSVQLQACEASELTEAILLERCNRVSK